MAHGLLKGNAGRGRALRQAGTDPGAQAGCGAASPRIVAARLFESPEAEAAELSGA